MVPDLGRAFENCGKDRNYESLGGATPSDFFIRDKTISEGAKSLLDICLGVDEKRISYFRRRGMVSEDHGVDDDGVSPQEAESMVTKLLATQLPDHKFLEQCLRDLASKPEVLIMFSKSFMVLTDAGINFLRQNQ